MSSSGKRNLLPINNPSLNILHEYYKGKFKQLVSELVEHANQIKIEPSVDINITYRRLNK